MDREVRQGCALFFAGREKGLIASECNPRERTENGQAYAQGVKRATGSVSAFKYMKEHTQHTLDLLRTKARL